MLIRKLQWNDERTIFIALFLALVVLGGLLTYVALTPAQEETFVSIYVLGAGEMAVNYPRVLVIGKNNTLSLWVGVENFMGKNEYCSVLVKVSNGTVQIDPAPFEPVKRYEKVLLDKETWEFPVIMALNQTGQYRVIFELWFFEELEGFSYSGRSSNVWLDVIES